MNTNTRKNIKIVFLASITAFMVTSISFIYPVDEVEAAPVIGFKAGRIIDDAVFTDNLSMSQSQIQQFLEAQVPVCDTYGTQPSEFGGGTRAEWAAARGYSPPFTCLRDFSEGGKTASQIIYDVAQQFSINPKVLIVLLQKEQILITDDWPIPGSAQYKTATGYACPDTAPCDQQYFGLTNQLTWSGRMFRAIMNASPTWYTPYLLGENYVQYNPNQSCGGSIVNIENRSTQALYNYTPYQPNPATLEAGWGQASCGAYGNRNFYLYFTSWFGSTVGPENAWAPMSTKLYTDNSYSIEIPNINGAFYLTPGQQAHVRVSAQNIGRTTWDSANTRLGTYRPYNYPSSLTDSSWLSPHRPSSLTESTVAPNGIGTFDFSITASTSARKYQERFAIVREGISWVENTYIDLLIYASAPYPQNQINTGNKIESGSIVPSGQYLYSPQKKSVLRLNINGNLELYVNSALAWESRTAGSKATKLINQPDGNLVLYTSNNVAVWSTSTSGGGASRLILEGDGDLVLYSGSTPIWSSGTGSLKEETIGSHFFTVGGAILPGQSINSPDGRYRLVLQGDGNLVLYSPIRAIWSTSTFGQMDKLRLQKDGNLVLYDLSNRPVWSSTSFGSSAKKLELQQDANLVLYDLSKPVWSSQTYLQN